MHRIDGPGHNNNKFTDGNPANGIPATVVTAEFMNDIQENIVHIIEIARTGMNKGDKTNLFDAIQRLIATRIPDLSSIASVQTGSIIIWPTGSVPTGYLECNGVAISRLTYEKLYRVIGTVYGNGNGRTTFNIPDLRGEFIRGWAHGMGSRDPDMSARVNVNGVTVGDIVGSRQGDEFKSHNHGGSLTNGQTGTPGSGYQAWSGHGGGPKSIAFRGGAETRPRNVNMMFCIKY